MTVTLRAGATRADILKVLMQGAGQASIMRLTSGEAMEQVDKGFSFVLEQSGAPVAIGGLWPAKGPAPLLDLAAARGMRTVYAIWFVCAPAASAHLRRLKRECAIVFGDAALAGAMIVADVDRDLKSAPKLARYVGLVPLMTVEGHDLWEFRGSAEPHA